jgi:hypothetical protein
VTDVQREGKKWQMKMTLFERWRQFEKIKQQSFLAPQQDAPRRLF